MPDDPLLASLLAATAAAPGDVPLRLHVAEYLAGRGRIAEALQHSSTAAQHSPLTRRTPPPSVCCSG